MKSKHFITIAIFIILSLVSTSMASSQNIATPPEKLLVIKGLYIGMDVYEARKIMEQLLGKDWKISPVGETSKLLAGYRFGDEQIFGGSGQGYIKPSITGIRGFAISDKFDYYHGYVSADTSDKVTRMSFNGKIIDYLFSTSNIHVDDFVEAFRKNYNMPELSWIKQGWIYSSPQGYTITIMMTKFIDIKKEEYKKEESKEVKIKFD